MTQFERTLRMCAIGSLMVSAMLPAQAADWFGRVCEVGVDQNNGIPGVSVTLVDAAGQQVTHELTDASGAYRISAPQSLGMQLKYEKIRYRARPTLKSAATPGQQPSTYLLKEKASKAYYAQVAKDFAAREGEELNAYAEAIASLDASDRAQVTEAMQGNNRNGPTKVLEAAVQRTQWMLPLQRYFESDDIWKAVIIKSDQARGSIKLYGTVGKDDYKRAAEAKARSIPGVKTVDNDLMVLEPG